MVWCLPKSCKSGETIIIIILRDLKVRIVNGNAECHHKNHLALFVLQGVFVLNILGVPRRTFKFACWNIT